MALMWRTSKSASRAFSPVSEWAPLGCGASIPLSGSSTAKPWFWLVMLTLPVRRSTTGWLAPLWPYRNL